MDEAMEVKNRINLVLSMKETLRRAHDRVQDYGNELLQYSIKWKDLDDHFDSIAEELSERCRNVEAREKAAEDRIRVVEDKVTELRSMQLGIEEVERNYRAKEEKLGILESRLQLCAREVVEKEKKLDSFEMKCKNKERELVSLCKAVDERRVEIKEKEKDLCLVQLSVEESEMEFRREDERLGFLMDRVDFCDQEISEKEEKLGFMEEKLQKCEMACRRKEEELISLNSVADERGLDIEEKGKELQSLQKSIEELHETCVLKKKEMEAQFALEVASKRNELDFLQVKLDDRSRELSSLENSIANYSKRLNSQRIELDMITKKATEFREKEMQIQQQKLKKLRTIPTDPIPHNDPLNGTQIKTEPLDFPTHHQQIFPTSGKILNSDSRIDSKMIQGELAHLKIDIDLPKLTLDEMDATYGHQSSREEKGFDKEAMKTHIKVLQHMTRSSTPISPQVKQGAMDLTAKWVWKLRTSTVDPLEALGFFNFLAAYKLASSFNQNEILRYMQMYSLHNKDPQLCQTVLDSGYVIPSPTDLQMKGNKKRALSKGLLNEQGTI